MTMKVLFISLCLLSTAFAQSTEVRTVDLDGRALEISELLKTSETKVEWRYETIPGTCYRTEIRRQCRQMPPQCRVICNGSYCRRVCFPPQVVCRDVAVRVPYPCPRTIRRRVEVRYDTNHHVNLILNIRPETNLSETVDIIAKTNELRVNQVNPIEYFIDPVVLDVREEYEAGLKQMYYDIRLDFTPRE